MKKKTYEEKNLLEVKRNRVKCAIYLSQFKNN